MALSNAEKQRRWREKRNALAKEAEAMRRVITKRRGRRAQPIDDVNAFISELGDFGVDYSQRFNAWRELGRFSPDDRDHLVEALHGFANEFSILAQELAGMNA